MVAVDRCDPTLSRICSWPNLLRAFREAARGKRGRGPAAGFERNLAENLLAVRDELRCATYRPGPYHSFHIHDPKRRLISAAPFRDRVVHHALCRVTEPHFERTFIRDSYANRRGKGTHRAIDRCQEWARRFRYVLPCDIRQHFAAIDHAILLEVLGRKLGDPEVLQLCGRIVASGEGVLAEDYEMTFFPGDDLLAACRPRGLPIGNLTSQFWSNCYLNGFDHFVKRELRCQAYLRYVDDFLLFADDKAQLWEWKAAVRERLARFRLALHDSRAQVRPVDRGIPWLGFVVFPTHRRVKRRNVVKFRRRLKGLARSYSQGRASREQIDASVRGWVNHVRYADTYGLRRNVLADVRLRSRAAARHTAATPGTGPTS